MSASADLSMILLAVSIVILCAGVFFFLSRRPVIVPDRKVDEEKKVLTRDLEETFKLGMDPCASGTLVMYTLQTCIHCIHLKHFLDEHGVECRLVYVDDFEEDKRSELMAKVRSFNPRGSFPTLVLPDGRVSVGYRPALVGKLLGIDQ